MLLATLLITTNSWAVIYNAGERTERVRPRITGGSVRTITSPAVNSTSTEGRRCDDGRYLPLGLIAQISNYLPPFEIEKDIQIGRSENTLRVGLSEYISNCLDLDYESKTINGATIIMVKNKFNYDTVLLDQEVEIAAGQVKRFTAADLSSMTENEKYEACLRKQGILRNFGTETALDRSQARMSVDSSIDINLREPINSAHKVLFGSPQAVGREYGAAFDYDSATRNPDRCFLLEEVANQPYYAFSTEEVRRQELLQICRNGEPEELKAALSSLGNAPDLQRILGQAYDESMKRTMDTKLEELEEIGRQIIDSRDEDELRQLARRYSDIVNELDSTVVEPLKERLKALMDERTDSSDERRQEIDDQIFQIDEIVGKYSERVRRYRAGDVIDRLLEFGFSNEASDIAEFTLKSRFLGRVYRSDGSRDGRRGRDAAVSLSSAESSIERGMRDFETRADESERVYYARTGQRSYTPEIQSRIRSASESRDRQWQRDIQRIQSYSQYCQRNMFGFMNNPSRCQYGQRNQSLWHRQALARRSSYDTSIARHSTMLERYSQYEAEGQRYNEARGGGGSYWDENVLGSYGLFDDGIGAGGAGAGYNASMYQMGPQMNPFQSQYNTYPGAGGGGYSMMGPQPMMGY